MIGLRPGEVIGFVLRQVTVNQSEGRATITIDEDTDARRTGQVHVTKQTPGLAITQFSAVPVEILPHGKSVLTWTTTGASSCRLVPHDRPSVPVDGNTEVSPPDSTTYTLVAEGDGTSIQQQVTVSVVSVRIINFDASPREVPLGGTTTFSWQVRGAESCVIEPFRKAVDPESGTYEHVIDSSGRYSLEACGYGRLRDASVQIHVMSAEITAFGAVPSPHIIEPGGESILHWATRWASGCRIEPDLGEVPLTGTRSVAPDETTTYTFTALGQDQKKRSLTVTVGAAIAWISCTAVAENPRQVMIAWEVAGGDTTLDVWNQTSPDPRPVDKVGSKQVTVGDEGVTHIKLTVTGPDTRAACELLLLGPAIKAGASLTQFELRSPSGVHLPRGSRHDCLASGGCEAQGQGSGGRSHLAVGRPRRTARAPARSSSPEP